MEGGTRAAPSTHTGAVIGAEEQDLTLAGQATSEAVKRYYKLPQVKRIDESRN